MKTEKKNQHYVPKFYLRNFSYQENGKQIGVYNVSNQKYIIKAPIRTQGSKAFFYGSDGRIEDALSLVEDDQAKVLKRIIIDSQLPLKKTRDHSTLTEFVVITNQRNPISHNIIKNHITQFERKLSEETSGNNVDSLISQITDEEIVRMSLSNFAHHSEGIKDLDYKLLCNRTSIPFITSDNPILKYNQFLESKKWPYGKTGYAQVGLQMLIPISSQLLILFYDPGIYKVGCKKQKVVNITNTVEINQINLLHFINCFSTIFFDQVNETYIRELHNKAMKYNRANRGFIEEHYLFYEGENIESMATKKKDLIITGATECKISLNISCIKIHSKGKAYQFDGRIAHIRPYCKQLMQIKD
jgi:hypothetical protein